MKKLLLLIILLIATATPLLAIPTQGTCGDNICRADTGEDKQTCPTDCGYLPPSGIIFELVDAHWGINGIEIQFNFYYDNQTRTILRQDQIYANGTIWPPLPGMYCHNANGNPELDKQLQKEGHCDDVTPARSPHQMINDAKCTFEINHNKFDFTTSPSYGKVYKLTIPVVNDGIYEGLIHCTSSLGNITWPAAFGIRGQHLDTYTAGPEVINNLPPEKVPSIYWNYTNRTTPNTINQTNATTSILNQNNNQNQKLVTTGFNQYLGLNWWQTLLIVLIAFTLSVKSTIQTIEYTWHKIIAKPDVETPIVAILITILVLTSIYAYQNQLPWFPQAILIIAIAIINFLYQLTKHIKNKRHEHRKTPHSHPNYTTHENKHPNTRPSPVKIEQI